MDLNLLPYSEKHSKDLEKKRQESLSNLVSGKTPKDVIYQKPGRGKGKQDYVPGWWFVQEMNNIFGYLWSMEVIENKIDEKAGQIVARVRVSVTMPGSKVIETLPDGTRTETSHEGLTITKEQFGGSDIKKNKADGKVIDLADDFKSAATDGFKKCCSLLGLAKDVYGPREVVDELAGLDEIDVKIRPLTLRVEKYGLGWSKAELVKWIETTSGKTLDKLYEPDIFSLLPKLPKGDKK